jgi:hypothetical protein
LRYFLAFSSFFIAFNKKHSKNCIIFFVLWRALACSGVLWHALACSGVLWRALACSGVLCYAELKCLTIEIHYPTIELK